MSSPRDPSTERSLRDQAAAPPLKSRLRARLSGLLDRDARASVLLFTAAALAVLWASSRWAPFYERLWETPLPWSVQGHPIEPTLRWFVDDVLMAVFFFSAGLDIRAETDGGTLGSWRRASLPALAALGGMGAPALVYLACAGGPSHHAGWGIPTATDIAFALGILGLLGKRVPDSLRVLLLALAVLDDVGAIVVIAVFYSPTLQLGWLAVAAVATGLLVALQWRKGSPWWAYAILACVLWASFLATGIHAALAGVVMGLLTPRRVAPASSASPVASSRESPADRSARLLRPWVAFGVMPAFALANAGVAWRASALAGPEWRIAVGVSLGLLLGKPLGIGLTVALARCSRIATLPVGLGWREILVLGIVAGEGFTMSLLVTQLAFDDPARQAAAKMGVLLSSACAAVLGLSAGRLLLRAPPATAPRAP